MPCRSSSATTAPCSSSAAWPPTTSPARASRLLWRRARGAGAGRDRDPGHFPYLDRLDVARGADYYSAGVRPRPPPLRRRGAGTPGGLDHLRDPAHVHDAGPGAHGTLRGEDHQQNLQLPGLPPGRPSCEGRDLRATRTRAGSRSQRSGRRHVRLSPTSKPSRQASLQSCPAKSRGSCRPTMQAVGGDGRCARWAAPTGARSRPGRPDQAGHTIRGDDLGRKIEERVRPRRRAGRPGRSSRGSLDLGGCRGSGHRRRRGAARPRSSERAGGRPVPSAAPRADAVARGTRRCSTRSAWSSRARGRPPAPGDDDAAIDVLRSRHLRPGDPPDGQHLLAAAFRDYLPRAEDDRPLSHRARADVPRERPRRHARADAPGSWRVTDALNVPVPGPRPRSARRLPGRRYSPGRGPSAPRRATTRSPRPPAGYSEPLRARRAPASAAEEADTARRRRPDRAGALRLGMISAGPFCVYAPREARRSRGRRTGVAPSTRHADSLAASGRSTTGRIWSIACI